MAAEPTHRTQGDKELLLTEADARLAYGDELPPPFVVIRAAGQRIPLWEPPGG